MLRVAALGAKFNVYNCLVLCLLTASAAVTTAVDIYSFGICALEVCLAFLSTA